MTKPIRYGVAAVLLAMSTGLTACGGGGDGARSASVSPSASAISDDQILAIVREFTQCLRDHGIANTREPRLVDGKLEGAGVTGPVDETAMEAANRACKSIADRLPQGIWGDDSRPVTAEELEKLGRFAQCLREHGLPDWPDPKGDGGFPIAGTPLETALKSDGGQQANRDCRKHYDGPIRVSKQ